MPNGSYADRFTRWEGLLQSLTANAQELPQITAELTELQDLVQQARVLRREQDAAKAQFQDNVSARRLLDGHGEELRQRISLLLKGRYGLHGDKLYAYGMRPKKARRSKKAASANPPPVTPAAAAAEPEKPTNTHPEAPAAPPTAVQ